MSTSVQFGYRVRRSDGRWSVKKYPHDLQGQPRYSLATGMVDGAVHGVDGIAVRALRSGQRRDKSIAITARNAGRLVDALVDGPGITASEIPVLKAARYAATGRTVQVTDAHGHWRDLSATSVGRQRFLDGMKGTLL